MTLETSLALPSTTAPANEFPALLASTSTSASVIIAAVGILIVHLVSLLQFPLPMSKRRGWRVLALAALAAVNPTQVDVAAFDLQLSLDSILCTVHSDELDAVALHMPLTTNLHTILCLIVKFVNGDWRSHAFPPEVPHLWHSPEKSILGADPLCFHSSQAMT